MDRFREVQVRVGRVVPHGRRDEARDLLGYRQHVRELRGEQSTAFDKKTHDLAKEFDPSRALLLVAFPRHVLFRMWKEKYPEPGDDVVVIDGITEWRAWPYAGPPAQATPFPSASSSAPTAKST